MANHKSALKRNRQNPKRCNRNKTYKTHVKNVTKKVMNEVEENNAEKEYNYENQKEEKRAKYGGVHNFSGCRTSCIDCLFETEGCFSECV